MVETFILATLAGFAPGAALRAVQQAIASRCPILPGVRDGHSRRSG
jgi:hypothetical protein